MRKDQIAVAAELLNMDPKLAESRAYDARDGIIRVSSDIRGLGSVLVGPDLSAMFFPSSVFPEQALEIWDTGKRTPKESFAVLHVGPDGTRRPPSRGD
jgi:hypothetical protein